MKTLDNLLLKRISEEIERRFECKVISISFVNMLGTPNVMCKIQYNDDFVYQPCEHFTPLMITFSEKSVTFMRRIDFFDCVKNIKQEN